MEFKEYKNAAYWQQLRNKNGQISLGQLVGVLAGSFAVYFLLFLAGWLEG